ncbi:hypothetical protein KGF54_005484 [Candida jiufengensis]|uniref:uncharacterized protein n=1 Tax=Candida jiufengensis TaxID=497108 RepID=UPI0022252334|nr:uncharacterized protein KGF54_005484 [Candida jiufengensis]KAI5949606.1 hypothetical protein KGF54_005484 [Candida jiufengensis]
MDESLSFTELNFTDSDNENNITTPISPSTTSEHSEINQNLAQNQDKDLHTKLNSSKSTPSTSSVPSTPFTASSSKASEPAPTQTKNNNFLESTNYEPEEFVKGIFTFALGILFLITSLGLLDLKDLKQEYQEFVKILFYSSLFLFFITGTIVFRLQKHIGGFFYVCILIVALIEFLKMANVTYWNTSWKNTNFATKNCNCGFKYRVKHGR